MTESRSRAGVLYAGGAFFIWGIVPLYFRALRAVSPFEIIAHRVLWSVVFTAALVAWRGREELRVALRTPGTLARLAVSSALIAVNWLTFVWAVNAGRVLETSLGYFITPQVNVLLGALVLGERLRRAQWVAVALAATGVLNEVWRLGALPWISLVLALTFGSYGLCRKQIRVPPLTGLFIETLIAAPVALGYLVVRTCSGQLQFARVGAATSALLVLLGVVTAVPLLFFAAGAQRLRLATIGFLQYLAPSMTFVLAVTVFGEPLGAGRVLTFLLIWAGVAVYAIDNAWARRGES